MSGEVKPGYKQTEVGVIPEDWEVKPLCNVAEIRSGIAKNSNISVSDPILVHYLRVANVQDGYLNLKEMNKIELSRIDLKRYAVLPGDVLMNEGGDLDKLGRGSLWQGEFNPCVHQNHVFVVRCSTELLPEYLNIWTGAEPSRRYFLVAGKQTTNLATINKTALGQLPVAVPALPEQRAIAEALCDMDALLDGLERLIAKKRDLKQAAMQQLLTGQTRLPGKWNKKTGYKLSEVGLTPKDWDVLPFKEQFNVTAGGDVNPKLSSSIQDEIHRYPIYSNALTDSGLYGFCSYADHPAGSITITARGTLGFATYRDHKYTAIGRVLVLHPKRSSAGGYFAEFINNRIKFAIESTGVPQLTAPQISVYPLAVPTCDEQTAIAAVLSDMDAELSALEARRDKTRALKQAMMQELLTGKTRLVPTGGAHA